MRRQERGRVIWREGQWRIKLIRHSQMKKMNFLHYFTTFLWFSKFILLFCRRYEWNCSMYNDNYLQYTIVERICMSISEIRSTHILFVFSIAWAFNVIGSVHSCCLKNIQNNRMINLPLVGVVCDVKQHVVGVKKFEFLEVFCHPHKLFNFLLN